MNPTPQYPAQIFQSDVVQDYLQHVARYSAFQLPASLERMFKVYHEHFFSEPRPLFTNDWGPESPNWKWQKTHGEAVFDGVQGSIGAALYHRDAMVRIERDILAFPDRKKLVETLGLSSIGGGNTRILDFEYHGYVFAFRHTLDHLIRTLAALIKHDAHSFSAADMLLKRFPSNSGLNALLSARDRHLSTLEIFLSTGDKKSVRDMIAHRKFVKAGTLNVNGTGIFLAQEGKPFEQLRTLSTALEEQMDALKDIVSSTLSGIIAGHPKA